MVRYFETPAGRAFTRVLLALADKDDPLFEITARPALAAAGPALFGVQNGSALWFCSLSSTISGGLPAIKRMLFHISCAKNFQSKASPNAVNYCHDSPAAKPQTLRRSHFVGRRPSASSCRTRAPKRSRAALPGPVLTET